MNSDETPNPSPPLFPPSLGRPPRRPGPADLAGGAAGEVGYGVDYGGQAEESRYRCIVVEARRRPERQRTQWRDSLCPAGILEPLPTVSSSAHVRTARREHGADVG